MTMLVQFGAVQNAVTDITTVANRLDGSLDDLASYLAPLVATWEGQAATDWAALRQRWDNDAADMLAVLRDIGLAVQTAHEISTVTGAAGRLAEVDGIHEVQVGDLEDRADEAAHEEFTAIYRRWHEGELGVALPVGESGDQVLDRYVPVLDDLRMRYLDDDTWHSDIVVVSHGAAIRLTGAVLADIDSSFAIEHHLANTEAVVLTPVADGRWNCAQWGTRTPPFDPVIDDAPAEPVADPMG